MVSRIQVGSVTIRWASKGISTSGRVAAMTSAPKVRFGTKLPSMTSHWMRSTPAFSRSMTASPRWAKSAGSTEGTISTERGAVGDMGTFANE